VDFRAKEPAEKGIAVEQAVEIVLSGAVSFVTSFIVAVLSP
jgi:hypothetical protein